MTPAFALATLAGAGAGTGLCLLTLARRSRGAGFRAPSRAARRLAAIPSRVRRRAVLACLAGAVAGALTRWPVAAIAAAALVVAGPSLGLGTSARTIGRLDALASWIESLRDVVAGGIGLEQAIDLTAATAQPALAAELGLLAGRLRAHRPLPETLHRLADDLDDGTADRALAALIIAADARGPGLVAILDKLATATRDQVSARRHIDASRRSTHRAVQIILGLTATSMGSLLLVNRSYLDAYRDAVGQLVLALALGLTATGLAWVRHLEHVDAPARFLRHDTHRSAR